VAQLRSVSRTGRRGRWGSRRRRGSPRTGARGACGRRLRPPAPP